MNSKFTLTPKLPNDTLTAKILSYCYQIEEAKLFLAVASKKSSLFIKDKQKMLALQK
jgi:hypothetical protein